MVLVDDLWPTALEGCLDMLIWLTILGQNSDKSLYLALDRRIGDLLPRQEEGLYEDNVDTLASFDRFFDLLYYQEMKNDELSGLRYIVAQWVVYKSDTLLQRSAFMRRLLQRYPGFKYTFAKVWVNIRHTRLLHGWVDILDKVPIHVTAVATDSDDPADFDGFNAWEQDRQRQSLDPDYVPPNLAPTYKTEQPNLRFLFFNGEKEPAEEKNVRFVVESPHDLHTLSGLGARRLESPENWSVSSSSSLESASSYELQPQRMAWMLEEEFEPLQEYSVRSNFMPELDDQMDAEDASDHSGRSQRGSSAASS